MREVLRPDGRRLTIAGVTISARGLGGLVTVHLRGGPGMRSAEDAQPKLNEALGRAALIEQLTIEISEPREYPLPAGPDSPGRGEDVGDEPLITLTVPDPGPDFGQVLLKCDEDGVLSWHLPQESVPAQAVATRTAATRTYVLGTRVPEATDSGKRGLVGAIGKKLLKVIAFELGNRFVGAMADYFVSRFEAEQCPHRLRLVTPDTYKNDANDLDGEGIRQLFSGPALLFIHGTASRFHKAFATFPRDFLSTLMARYEGRIFAFDHPTLSVTPIENVSWLAKIISDLPSGTMDLDVVAHSRGGLVGRTMCEHQDDAGLDAMRLKVRNLVMVATPNSGTPLADRKHVGSFVDTFTNLLEFFPDNPATDTLDIVLTVLKQVAVGAIGGLDGLLSMEPGGHFLREVLNTPSPTTARYRALASNYEPGSDTPLGRYTRNFLADAVFLRQENDLVVPTDGVFRENGAPQFPITERVHFKGEEAVDHSGFWDKPRAIRALDMWLSREPSQRTNAVSAG
jgi:hypothetical protein